jgi:hypothetical protein
MSFFTELFKLPKNRKKEQRKLRVIKNPEPLMTQAEFRAKQQAGFRKIIEEAIAKSEEIKQNAAKIAEVQRNIRANYPRPPAQPQIPTRTTTKRSRAHLTVVR